MNTVANAPTSHAMPQPTSRDWTWAAIASLMAESDGCAETPLHELPLPGFAQVRLVL